MRQAQHETSCSSVFKFVLKCHFNPVSKVSFIYFVNSFLFLLSAQGVIPFDTQQVRSRVGVSLGLVLARTNKYQIVLVFAI